MQTPLAAVWSQVTELIEQGYSVIPVHEDGPSAKRPFTGWKKFQDQLVTPAELWHQMAERFHTNAIAMLCGKVSGNLELIDIDVKHKEGIAALLFRDIQELFPNLWERLRIHKSPSGGYHIPYRIIDNNPGKNTKLAGRLSTQEELKHKPEKEKYFLETRGEGGYFVAPPSLGYSVYKIQPIPYLTWQERNDLFALCRQYNEVIKAEKPPTPKRIDDYYDENPFDHFSKSQAGQDILLSHGWKANGHNASFLWFTRPGSKSGERHASFIRNKNLFWFWTTNEQFNNSKCYSPANVLNILDHTGDWKATHRALVAAGYGKIKPEKEARIIKANQVPANLSQEAKQQVQARQELYPHGVFWNYESDTFSINREAYLRVGSALGFMYHDGGLVYLQNGILTKKNERHLFDALKQYIQEKDDDLLHTYEAFIQASGNFIVSRLPLLDLNLLLVDTPTKCYKFYSNIWLEITAEGYTEYKYDQLPGYVWKERIQKREFRYGTSGKYIDFLDKAVEYSHRREHVQRIIGYLAHEYKHPTLSYIIVITEQCADPRQGGGSGKNLFCSLFGLTTTETSKAGSQVKYDEKFLQSWNGERIFTLADVPKNFDFLFLKDLSSGTAIVKKLWRNEETIANEAMPKFVVHTNYSYEITDGGLKRRIIPLEFTDFFTKCGGVDVHYRTFFPDGWTSEDWAGYDGTIVDSLVNWIAGGLKIAGSELTEGGWQKQFEQAAGPLLAEFIQTGISEWIRLTFLSKADFKNQLSDFYQDNNVPRQYQPTMTKVNRMLTEYCFHNAIPYDPEAQKKVNGINIHGKGFSSSMELKTTQEEDDTPF